MKAKRLIQFIIGVHRIHHITYSYGWKLPFLEVGWFKEFGFKKLKQITIKDKPSKPYHNCTKTGVY